MLRITAVLALFALAACASSSGAYRVDGDSYRITTTAITSFGGAGTAKGAALKAATDTCAKEGKKPLVTSDKTDSTIASGSVDVTFRCVN